MYLVDQEVNDFIETCDYTGRTLEENLKCLLDDNPDDGEYFTAIYERAKSGKEEK